MDHLIPTQRTTNNSVRRFCSCILYPHAGSSLRERMKGKGTLIRASPSRLISCVSCVFLSQRVRSEPDSRVLLLPPDVRLHSSQQDLIHVSFVPNPSMLQSMHLSICQSSIHLSIIHPSVNHPSIYKSIHPSMR